MAGPFVSVVVPVRNEVRYIEQCLASIAAQDFPADRREILVIDGMSDDGTREIIESARRLIPSIRLVDNPKQTVSAGVNAGIRAARGLVIVRMDAHARYGRDYISTCLAVQERTGAANVGGPAIALAGGGSPVAWAIALAHHSAFGLGGGRFRAPGAEGFVETVWPGCFRREVFDAVGFLDERRARTEDLEFNTRLRRAGHTIYLSPLIRAAYYCRTTLRGIFAQRWADGVEITRFLPSNPYAPKLRHLVPLAFILSLLCLAMLALIGGQGRGLTSAPWLLAAEIAAYAGAGLLFTVKAWRSRRETLAAMGAVTSAELRAPLEAFLLLPLVFAALHLSYGLGSLWGLLTQPSRPAKSIQ